MPFPELHIFAEVSTTPAKLRYVLRDLMLDSSAWSNPYDDLMLCGAENGAQFAIDLTGGGPVDKQRLRPMFWRTHTGQPGGGVDALQRSLYWSRGANDTLSLTMPIHVRLAAGPTLFYLDIEGPRSGEEGDTAGSLRQYLFVSPIRPYFDGDIPAVAVGGCTSTPGSETPTPEDRKYQVIHVSRNRANTASWVPGKIFTLTPGGYNAGMVNHTKWQPYAAGDQFSYVFPWVVLEDIDGIRGRLTDLFYGGVDQLQTDGVAGLRPGQVFGYKGGTYKLLRSVRNDGTDQGGSFGYYSATGGVDQSPLIGVRTLHQGLTWQEVEVFTWDQMAAMF